MESDLSDFSFRSRKVALSQMKRERFDLLVIGGGITGAAVARDAASRGLKVALVEQSDFASGTSSRSSKLIHGGLRYLENFEFGLVFEALSERSHLLKTVPFVVKPLKFFLPVYEKDPHGMGKISIGLWFYDLLSFFRSPGFHKRLSRKRIIEKIPFLKKTELRGGFEYFDASMWDDVLTIEVLRSAKQYGACIANYIEAVAPVWEGEKIRGFRIRDTESSSEFELKAEKVVVCTGPWTDELGKRLSPDWNPLLSPSKGAHIVFSLKRFPVPGAVVMSHPQDGRIAFVIPRPEFGEGVVIVGTTDGPVSPNDVPNQSEKIEKEEIDYLFNLLDQYFPELQLKSSDILSAYIGVRPLVGGSMAGSEGQRESQNLQKVSREHHICEGPGGVVCVAGGKYTTHRVMAQEIVDFALHSWKKEARKKLASALPSIRFSQTQRVLNPQRTSQSIKKATSEAKDRGWDIPQRLLEFYGTEALELFELHQAKRQTEDYPGFPLLECELRYHIRQSMVLHLEDFYFRRTALFLACPDHGVSWAQRLAEVWGEEFHLGSDAVQKEHDRLLAEIRKRTLWSKGDLSRPGESIPKIQQDHSH